MAAKSWASAVITGSGSGLGRALAIEAARRGTPVVVSDVDEVGMAETVRLVGEHGVRAIAVPCDVRDPAQVQHLAEAAIDAFGALDLWVNNAGVAVAGRVGDVPLDDWAWVLDVNLKGVVHGCHAAIPHLRQHQRGHVLNVASAAGLISTPEMGPYNVSKAAVVSLSETLYGELKGSGVGVTVLCPTFFQTQLLQTARTTNPGQTKVAARLMKISRTQADGVARAALDACTAGSLYCAPMFDGRLFWRLKRAAPQTFYDLMPRIVRMLDRR